MNPYYETTLIRGYGIDIINICKKYLGVTITTNLAIHIHDSTSQYFSNNKSKKQTEWIAKHVAFVLTTKRFITYII